MGSEVTVEEGTIAGVESETGLPVPQALIINKAINPNQ
jgi:hypothetical protein